MSRADLLALTPESLAALANLGLVKRAQREIADGAGPSLAEEGDGTIVGAFTDGTVARLPRSTPLREAPCTCGASGVCRHRIAVALAYASWHAREHEGEPPPPSARVDAGWSPALLDDAALEQALGAKLLVRARAALRDGLLVAVDREGVPVAKLPSCTVRFLVPGDVAYARCDCAETGACEHVAIAAWAFREAGADGGIVSLGGAPSRATEDHAPLDVAMALAREVLTQGMRDARPAPGRFAELRQRLSRAGMTWIHGLVVDLEVALEGYQKRSALFGAREVAALLFELAARSRAGRRTDHALPPRFVLGADAAPETLLDHVRLVSLGARVRADGQTRFADVYLADPDTTLVLVLQKRWDFAEGVTPDEGPTLARRPVAARITLSALAKGQLVSKVVTRRANHSVSLATSRALQTSVTPQRGDWSGLAAPLVVHDLREHEERAKKLPPRILRPRVLADSVHVVGVSGVARVAYSSAEQRLVADLVDTSGHPFRLRVMHRSAAPNAIEAVAVALQGTPRFVAGDLLRGAAGWEVDALSVVTDEMVVPDVAERVAAAPPRGDLLSSGSTATGVLMTLVTSSLEEVCHVGLAHVSPALLDRMKGVVARLEEAGLRGLARRLGSLEEALRRRATDDAAEAWMSTGIRLALSRDASVG